MGARADLSGCEKSPTTGIRSSDRPARSKGLCRLRYSGPQQNEVIHGNSNWRNVMRCGPVRDYSERGNRFWDSIKSEEDFPD